MGDWENTATSWAVRLAVGVLFSWICLGNAGTAFAAGGSTLPSAGLLLKKYASPTELVDGDLHSVQFSLTLINTGNETLEQVQVTDHVAREMLPAEIVSVSDLEVSGGLATVNASFDGRTDVRLLSGLESLDPGAEAGIRFRVFFSTGGQPGPFYNVAVATGTGRDSGKYVSECSLSSKSPKTRPAKKLDDACQPTPVEVPAQDPRVGLAKQAAIPDYLGDGWYRSRITFTARNYGAGKAQNVQIYDDLAGVFAGAPFAVESLSSSDWPVNPGFDGNADRYLLAGGADLRPDQSASVFLVVRFRPVDFSRPLVNQACASADGADCDLSTDGDDPDPDGDDHPDESEKTEIFDPVPLVGLASAASPVRYPGGRTVEFDLHLVVRNMGNTPLDGISIDNDLAAMFGADVSSFRVLPGSLTGDGLPVAPGYDGSGSTNLLDAAAALGPGESATVSFTASFVPVPDAGAFESQSVARTRQGASDLSTDGEEPDPNRDGIPKEGEPTPIRYRLPSVAAVALTKEATVAVPTGPGVFEAALSFRLENTGAVPLTELRLTDDLTDAFPSPTTFEVVPGSLTSPDFAVNAAFDGAADVHLLAPGNGLPVGGAGRLEFRVSIQPNDQSGPFFNRAFVTSAEGAEDESQAKIGIQSNPEIGVVKSAGPVESVVGEEDAYRVSFQVVVSNLGDVPLNYVQVMDDLSETFPASTEFSLLGAPRVTGDLTSSNPGYGSAGGGFALLSGAETLAVGAEATIEFEVRFTTRDERDVFFNTAFASAVAPDGTPVFGDSGAPIRIEVPGHLRGTVYLDLDHNRQFDPEVDETLDGWRIDLLSSNRTSVRNTTTANAGTYSVADIPPATYEVQFRHPETNVAWSRVEIVIVARGKQVLNLPIDPQGVVYDAATRTPLPGAVLSILDADGRPLPEACLLPDQQAQPVGSGGMYKFTILHGTNDRCPSVRVEYRVTVSDVPEGYRAGLSELIPPEPDAFNAENCAADPCLVQAQNGPPEEGSATTYYSAFLASDPRETVVNNHFPVDPDSVPPPPPPPAEPLLTLEKAANRRRATVGSVVGYTLTLENQSDLAISGAEIADRPPPAFQLQTDSGLLVRAGFDGVLGTPDDERLPLGAHGTDVVAFEPVDFAPHERLQIRYVSRVSTAAKVGEHTNTATASYGFEGQTFTVTDTAVVEVDADPLFTRATVIGKVFHDDNGNGVQDRGEAGMHKVRLITPEGLIVVTDAEGRYHIADIEVTRDYGANYALKLDANTLPDGWESRSDPRQVVHLMPGGIGRVNFAVASRKERPVRLDCCGTYHDYRYLDPYQTEKRLDVRPVSLSRKEQTWTATFGVSSNYTHQAPYYRLEVFHPDDVAMSRSLAGVCGILEDPHELVSVENLDRPAGGGFIYRLKVYERRPGENPREVYATSKEAQPNYPKLDCDLEEPFSESGGDRDRRHFDVTHGQEVQLPRLGPAESFTWRGDQTISPGSALALDGVLINRVVQAKALRQYECANCPDRRALEVRDRLIDRALSYQSDMRGSPDWYVQPKSNSDLELAAGEFAQDYSGENVVNPPRQLPPEIDMEVKFDSEPTRVGRTWLQRDLLFQPSDVVVFGAEGLETSMRCCDVATSVETVTDQDNDVYAVRLRNDSPDSVTTAFRLVGVSNFRDDALPPDDVDCGPLMSGPFPTTEDEVAPLSTREFFLGGFYDGGAPKADRSWDRVCIDITSDALPGKPTMRYVIDRGRYEENGQWRPPRTTAHCLEVGGQPQITENGDVAAVRVHDGDSIPDDVVDPIVPIASVDTNMGIAVIDLTVGGRSASGGLEELVDELGMDGGFTDGRIAAYWRGIGTRGEEEDYRWVVQMDTTKDDLDNLFDNLKRKDPNRIFRQLDTDHYYPTYGDDSTTTLDTNTQGAVYARIESNRSHALWGNYSTGLTGTEFAQYNRSLYGAFGEYQSKSLTWEGDSRFQLKVFGSEAETASGHASFLATGGSLYYLPHTDIVMGSEKVWVEVRRRDTEQVEEREVLVPGRDYEIDPLQGRILLQSPLSQVVRERLNNVIRSRPLEGDDVILFVDYEYLTRDFAAEDYVYGLRGRAWVSDRLAVGATHVTDEQGAEDYQLNGLDLLWRYEKDSYLSVEFARSESEEGGSSAFSLDGGLTFEDDLWNTISTAGEADALGLEARINLADFDAGEGVLRGWWKQRDEGFSSGRFSPGPQTTDLGFDFDTALGSTWRLSGGATDLDREGDRKASTARMQTAGRWQCGSDVGERGCAELDLEARYEDLKLASGSMPALPYEQADGSATLLGARAGYWVSDTTSVYTSLQTAVSTQRDYEDNDLIAMGTNTRLSNRLAMSLEASDGDRGSALIAGADYRVNERASFNVAGGVGSGALSRFAGRYELSEGHELFGTYTMDPDRTDGARNLVSVGQRRDLGDRTRIFTESQFGRGFGEHSNGHVGGIELDVADWVLSTTVQASSVSRRGEQFDRVAASVGATFRSDATRLSSRIEVRDDDGPTTDARQYVTSSSLAHQVNEDSRLMSKLNLAWTDNRFADVDAGRFAEFALGYAYRPVNHDRFNGMMRYGYLYDVATLGQSDAPGDEKAHVFSTEGYYEVTDRLEVGGKLAYRGGKSRIEKGEGEWYDISLGMAVARASFKVDLPKRNGSGRLLPDQLELLGEYRWLKDFEGRSTSKGALLGIYREIDPRHWSDRKPDEVVTTTKRQLLPPSLRVGVGYNFSGFDDDMRMDNYKSHGWFLDLMAVF